MFISDDHCSISSLYKFIERGRGREGEGGRERDYVYDITCVLTSDGLRIMAGTKCLTRRMSLDMNCMSPLEGVVMIYYVR